MNELSSKGVGVSTTRWGRLPRVEERPRRAIIATFVALAAFVALASPAPALAAVSHGSPVGAVYVAGNAYSGNAILAFPRYADGTLGPAGPGVPTGGRGSGPGLLLPDDPLGSQGSLIADQGHMLLFAVNAGSDDVSVLAISGNGLTLVDRRPSDGAFPVSLALSHDTLYVLNAVGNSVAGFNVDGSGHLTHLQTCALPGLPAGADPILPGTQTQSAQPVMVETPGQVGVSPDGKHLVVVSKEGPLFQTFPFGRTLGSGRIHVYDVDARTGALTNCGNPTTTALPSNGEGKGKFPFSLNWSAQGALLLTEVFGVTTSLSGSALSSFALGRDGSLTPISTSVGSGQGAVCWIVRSGKSIYAANNVGNNISAFEVNGRGQLKLNAGQAAAVGQSPTDMAITGNGRFIYQLTTGSAQVWPFAVTPTGGLTALGPVADGLPEHSGQVGIATVDFG